MAVQSLNLEDRAIASQVLEVQHAAYRVEAELIGSTAIPALHESVEDLMALSLRWLAVVTEGRIVAVLGFTEDGENIDIDRLVVAPDAMRRGHASALVEALEPATSITVSTGTLNEPARAFYRRHGFVEQGESTPAPGVSVTHFVRRSK